MAGSNSKKSRTSRRSNGERRSSRKVTLTPIEKILMGGGLYRSMKGWGSERKSAPRRSHFEAAEL